MKVILISYGSFSRGLLETMEIVLSEQQDLSYVGLYPYQRADIPGESIGKEFTKADEGKEILVLTDLSYGSPFNTAVQLMSSYDVHHLIGVDVPLLMEILPMGGNGKSAAEVCDEAMELAGGTVQNVKKYLTDMLDSEENEKCETSL